MIDRCKQCGAAADPFLTKSEAIALLEDRIVALTIHNQNLLITNTEYLNRARSAEHKLTMLGHGAAIFERKEV